MKNRANRAANGSKGEDKKTFSNRSFRKELNLLAKSSSKKQVLDLYASAIKREQVKLAKKSAKKREREASDDSDSDTGGEAYAMCVEPKCLKSALKPRAKKRNDSVMTEEEKAYQKKISWLKDHGKQLAAVAKKKSDKEDGEETSDSD